jgi:ATP-dependent DNA ligase
MPGRFVPGDGIRLEPRRMSLTTTPRRRLRQACAKRLEGIVSKRLTAPYRSGPSRDWLKVKNPDSPAVVSRGAVNSAFSVGLSGTGFDHKVTDRANG